eukprot:Rmarinus@m.2375
MEPLDSQRFDTFWTYRDLFNADEDSVSDCSTWSDFSDTTSTSTTSRSSATSQSDLSHISNSPSPEPLRDLSLADSKEAKESENFSSPLSREAFVNKHGQLTPSQDETTDSTSVDSPTQHSLEWTNSPYVADDFFFSAVLSRGSSYTSPRSLQSVNILSLAHGRHHPCIL